MSAASRLRSSLAMLIALAVLVPCLSLPAGQVQAGGEKVDPALKREMASDPGKKVPIIVQMAPARKDGSGRADEQRARDALALFDSLGADGKRVGSLSLIGGAAGFANARGIDSLSAKPGVAFIFKDSAVQASDVLYDVQPAPQLPEPYPLSTRANKLWQEGTTGKGIGVAVLDSGIAPHQDLTLPSNRIVASANFAGDLGGMPDAGGHGTHIAGTIAGNSTRFDLSGRQVQFLSADDTSQADYVGMAPGASLIDVRVLDSRGAGRISSVVAGIQWVLANKAKYNIRVINLSLSGPAGVAYRQDPLSAAVEIAWKRGVVVVAAAGNGGPGTGTVGTPGIDPYVITVGATEDQRTVAQQDDMLASFSSWGTPAYSSAKPDVVAPGRQIVSLRVPGSYLDQQMPDRVVAGRSGPNYFRLTGTSMSAAIVSGAVALMLQHQPGLSPDRVKAILAATVQPYGQNSSTVASDPSADGAGMISAYSAANSSNSGLANRGLRPADPLAAALYPVLYGQPLTWKDPDYAGINWNNLAWDNLAWDNLAWDNLAWDNLAWDNLAWDNLAWDNLAWDNLAWDNLAWDHSNSSGQPLD